MLSTSSVHARRHAPDEALMATDTQAAAANLPNFGLTDEQRTLRDWMHEFAERTVRPAAAEWDEREETPWPILQEAARHGIYSLDLLAQTWSDPTGLMLPVVIE